MKKITFLIAFILFTCLHYQIGAQTGQNPQYLYQTGIEDSLYSNILAAQRTIWVQLPEGYRPENKTKYPVIYILDGGVQLKALETVYNYYNGHHLPEMILVGISNRSNRTRDLTTSAVTWRNGGAVREETGGAEQFTQFIAQELIPYIDRKYPTTPYRTLIGHSYGGLFTINTLIHHPQLFENYIAIDPSLDWDHQKLLKQAYLELQRKDFNRKSLFVSLGAGQLHLLNGEITMDNVLQDTSEYSLFARSIIEFATFAEKQKQNGLNFEWKHYPDDYHWTVPLPSIRDGLIAQFKWYQLEGATQFSNPDTPLAELIELVKTRAQILTDHFGYPAPPLVEDLFNQTGYMYLQFGQLEKSHAFFEMGIEYYPESANAYDAMADFYEAQEDYSKALKYVTKAYELSGNNYHKNRIETLKTKE